MLSRAFPSTGEGFRRSENLSDCTARSGRKWGSVTFWTLERVLGRDLPKGNFTPRLCGSWDCKGGRNGKELLPCGIKVWRKTLIPYCPTISKQRGRNSKVPRCRLRIYPGSTPLNGCISLRILRLHRRSIGLLPTLLRNLVGLPIRWRAKGSTSRVRNLMTGVELQNSAGTVRRSISPRFRKTRFVHDH